MKTFFKQAGKALCYYLLFLGMQFIVTFGFMFVYQFVQSFKWAALRGAQDAAADMGAATGEYAEMVNQIAQDSMNFVMENTNWISIISGCLTLLTLWIFFLIRKKKLFKETNITGFSVKYVPIIIVLGFTLATTVSFGMNILPASWLEDYAEQSEVLTTGNGIAMVLAVMVMAPVLEEIIFRGLILSRLRKAVPLTWAVILTSLLFGVTHGQIVWIIYATLLGLLLSLVAVKMDSLAASILFHMSFNVFGTVVPIVFGGIDSMALGMVIAAVALVASVALLVWLLRGKKTGENCACASN